MTSELGFTVQLDAPFDAALEQVTAALKTQGFGVLTKIDVQATLKEKLNIDRDKYAILGACNPPLAHRALELAPEVGLLLPCNVIVYENADGGSTVSIVDPLGMLQLVDNADLSAVAREAQDRLRQVAEALR
jgi:uncharacterized protein (DUF302 family)